MFSKELVGRAFECLEEGINHPRYSAAKCRREIRDLMCEAGAGTLLESLALKGADIPPQSDQHGGDESDSEGGVEEIKEPTIQDLAAEQLSHAAQLKGLHEDMESLKDSVYSGEKGLDKVMGILSSLFTAVQGMAAKTGFKLPTGLVEVLNSDEPTTSTAAAPPPHRTPAASLEAPVNMIAVPHASTTAPSHARPAFCATTPCTVQGQGATPGAHKSEAGHSGLAAVPSSTTQGQPVSAAGVATAAGGLAGNGEGAQRASAAQAGAPDVAFPSARRQAGASAASSSMAPATQGGEIGEVPGKRGWTGVTKKLDKDEWIARIVLDRASQSLIVINSHFGTEEEAARSIAAASHVMFVDKPTRGELIHLTAADKAKLSDCSAHQCEVMVRMKFWHMWEEWRKYWLAAKAKWDEKTRRDEKKRAAIKASLEEADARADKIARLQAGGNSGHAYASHEEGSGSKDG
ncbi:unnamed protein product [Closterium sp. NIES-64]|nr:unnamed protein product [Closterium sp. NIES-64]